MNNRINKSIIGALASLSLALIGLLLAKPAYAQPLYWDGSATPNATYGISAFNPAANWSTVSGATTPDPAAIPGTGNIAVFNLSTPMLVALNGGRSVAGLEFSGTGATSLYSHPASNTSNILTLGTSGLFVSSGAGAVTTVSNGTTGFLSYRINGNQSWTNDSSNLLTMNGGISNVGTATPYSLTLAGSGSGGITLAAAITNNSTGTLALAVNASGTGAMTLLGASTFSGGTTLTAGTLRAGVASVGSVGSVTSSAFGTGTLTLNGGTLSSNGATARTILNAVTVGGNVTLGDSTNTGTLTFSANADLGAGTRQLTIASSSFVVFNGVLSNGGLTKAGSGTLTLSGANTFEGNSTITTGTVRIGASSVGTVSSITSGPLGTGTLVLNGGTLSSNSTTARSILNAVTVGGDITLGNGTNTGTLTFSGATDLSGGTRQLTTASAVQFDGDLSNGGITKAGSGTLTLNGANTYSGGTTISEGTVQGSIGTGALSVASGATYVLNGTDRSIAAISGAGNVNLGANTLTTSSSANSMFSGVVSGTGGLTKSGSGTLTLSGANDYTGNTTVDAGTLSLGASNSLADVSNIILSGGTLATNSFADSVGTLSLLGNSIIDFTGGGSFAFANSAAATWTGGMTLSLTSGFVSGSSLRFGADASGLGLSQLAQITGGGYDTFSLDSSGYLVGAAAAIPEPSTYAAMAGLAALGCAFWRRRRAALSQRTEA